MGGGRRKWGMEKGDERRGTRDSEWGTSENCQKREALEGRRGNGAVKNFAGHKPHEYASRICLSAPGTVWFTGVGRSLSWEEGR